MPTAAAAEHRSPPPHSLQGFVFWPMIVAILFFVIGFSSVGWEVTFAKEWIGLWSTCYPHAHWYNGLAWFKATQGMLTIALTLLVGSFITIAVYKFLDCTNKSFQLKMFAALDFAAVLFMVIGFIIYGSNHRFSLNWSFAFCVIGAIVSFTAGIISIVQLRQ